MNIAKHRRTAFFSPLGSEVDIHQSAHHTPLFLKQAAWYKLINHADMLKQSFTEMKQKFTFPTERQNGISSSSSSSSFFLLMPWHLGQGSVKWEVFFQNEVSFKTPHLFDIITFLITLQRYFNHYSWSNTVTHLRAGDCDYDYVTAEEEPPRPGSLGSPWAYVGICRRKHPEEAHETGQ